MGEPFFMALQEYIFILMNRRPRLKELFFSNFSISLFKLLRQKI